MSQNAAQKLIAAHLVSGHMIPGDEIALRVDQTLTQDATGTMVMLELEALGVDRVRTEVSVQYVDHNLLQTDGKNAEDHEFLRSACQRFGLWYSKAGNGVSHPTHMQRFGIPGKTIVGSDSHTPAAGSLGMLAIGLGGLEVATAMAGEPVHLRMPEIWGVRLRGELPAWVSAKDVILEMLRRHGVTGGVNRIIEYHGPGLARLTAMDRHVIANMGAELGATSTVFPADEQVRAFLRAERREDDFVAVLADEDAVYDVTDEIDLSTVEPLIALPSSPGKVVPVREVAGHDVEQVVVGSSANPGLRDFAVVAAIVRGRQAHARVSLDVNPSSRQILQDMTRMGATLDLIAAGARLHQSGCLGCIGMGQAPAAGSTSLRTFPRNFPGRSGTNEDSVFLCSPETAAAAALTGQITDPRDLPELLGIDYPHIRLPAESSVNAAMLEAPLAGEAGHSGQAGQGIEHRLSAELRAAARTDRGTGRAQGRRRHIHRCDPAGRRPSSPLSQQHPQAGRVHVHPDRCELRRTGIREQGWQRAHRGGRCQLRTGIVARARCDRAALPRVACGPRCLLRAHPLAEPDELWRARFGVRRARRLPAGRPGRRPCHGEHSAHHHYRHRDHRAQRHPRRAVRRSTPTV